MDEQLVEVLNDGPDILFEFSHGDTGGGQIFDALLFPLFMKLIGGAGNQLIGTHPVEYAHKYVSINDRLHGFYEQRQGEGEAGIGFQSLGTQRDDRDLRHTGPLQGAADKADVIGGTAAAACLAHKYGSFIEIIFSGEQSFHDLAYYDQRRIAGIIIDIF